MERFKLNIFNQDSIIRASSYNCKKNIKQSYEIEVKFINKIAITFWPRKIIVFYRKNSMKISEIYYFS